MKYMPIIVQQDATIYSLFISVNRSTYCGWYLRPSSGSHVTVSTALGISTTVTATFRERDWTETGTSSRPVTLVTRTRWNRNDSTSSWSPAGRIIGALYHTLYKHSLALLRRGEIIARNMLSWLKLLIKLLLLHLVDCLYCYILCFSPAKTLIFVDMPELIWTPSNYYELRLTHWA